VEGSDPAGSFAGVATAVGVGATASGQAVYTVTLAPELDRLSLDSDYRVFQDVGAPELLQRVLEDRPDPVTGFAFPLDAGYDSVEFEVQYAESSLAFLRRIAEREGIHYHFAGDGSVVFGDSNGAFPSSGASVPLGGPGGGFGELSRFRRGSRLAAARATVRGFDFERPGTLVEASASAAAAGEEVYRYSPAVTRSDRAARLASLELERARALREAHTGASSAPGIRAGRLFDVSDATGNGLGGSYLATRVRHAALRDGGCFAYGNAFEAIPSGVAFRPRRSTPTPSPGLATAIVTGPAGQAVHVDQHGRIKVQFHWDRQGSFDDASSAWVRVAVPAGRLAESFVPQVGDEVVVAFLQGDPSLPIVLGGLYNGQDPPPSSP
jgi:type VI secretion system secreted protein VgrG